MLFLVPFTLALSQINFVLADSSGSYYGNHPCTPNPNDDLDIGPCSASGPPGSLCVATLPAFYGGYYCGTEGAACVIDGNCDGGYCLVVVGDEIGACSGGLGDGCNGTPRCMTGLGCGNDANAFCGGIDAICSPVTSIPGGTLANWHCDSTYCNPSNLCAEPAYGNVPCTSPGGLADQTLCAASDLPDSTCGSVANHRSFTNHLTFWCGITGAKCTADTQCDKGRCDPSTGVCQGGPGDFCDATNPCLGNLKCSGPGNSTCGGLGASCSLDNIVPRGYLCDPGPRYYCDTNNYRCSALTYGGNPCTGLDGLADQTLCAGADGSSTCSLEAVTQTFWSGLQGAGCNKDLDCDRGSCVNGACAGGFGDRCKTYYDCLGGLNCNDAYAAEGNATCGGVGAKCSYPDNPIYGIFPYRVALDNLCSPEDKCSDMTNNAICISRTPVSNIENTTSQGSTGSLLTSSTVSDITSKPTKTPDTPASDVSQSSSSDATSDSTTETSLTGQSVESSSQADAGSDGSVHDSADLEGDLSNSESGGVDTFVPSDAPGSGESDNGTDEVASNAESSVTADYAKTATSVIDALQQIGVTVLAEQVNAVISALQAGDGTITEDGIIAVLRALQLGNGTVTQAVVDAVIQALQSTGGVVTQAEVEALIVGSAGNSTAAGQAIMSLLKSGVLGSFAGLPFGVGALSSNVIIIVSNITNQTNASALPTSSTTQSISTSTTSSSDPTHTTVATTAQAIATHSAGMLFSARLDVVTGLLFSWIIVFI